jgi:hypothetical protein
MLKNRSFPSVRTTSLGGLGRQLVERGLLVALLLHRVERGRVADRGGVVGVKLGLELVDAVLEHGLVHEEREHADDHEREEEGEAGEVHVALRTGNTYLSGHTGRRETERCTH